MNTTDDDNVEIGNATVRHMWGNKLADVSHKLRNVVTVRVNSWRLGTTSRYFITFRFPLTTSVATTLTALCQGWEITTTRL